MRLSLTGRHIEISPALRQLVLRRLARVERLLNDSAVSAQVVLTLEKRRHRTEITLHARGDNTLTAVNTADAWPQSIGEAFEKIALQGRKVKDKWRTRKRRAVGGRGAAEEAVSAATEPAAIGAIDGAPAGRLAAVRSRIVRMTRYPIKPMRLEDAALRIAEVPESFVVFRHAETERLAILFERPDGRLGLIDPEL
jgi:putative sigma-54 modulation protein